MPPSRVEYTYDPARPTPSAGGPSFNPLNAGARSQRAIERRPDVLVFTSPPLAAAAAIVGKVRLVLRASCAAPSIDLVGRLCLVGGPALGGGAVNLVEGALRLHRGWAAEHTWRRTRAPAGTSAAIGPSSTATSAPSLSLIHI